MRALALTLLFVSAASARDLDFTDVRADVETALLSRDVRAWARELSNEPNPTDLRTAMVHFEVYVRAGHWEGMAASIGTLAGASGYAKRQAIDELIIHGNEALAKLAMERWPAVYPFQFGLFLDQWAKRDGAAPGEAWYEARARAHKTWLFPWLSHLRGSPRAEREVAEYEARARKHSKRADAILEYLGARGAADSKRDLGWIAAAAGPWSLADSWRIARRLIRLDQRGSIALLERTRTMELTARDLEALEGWRLVLVPDPHFDVEADLREQVLRELVRLYMATEQPEKAQGVLAELGKNYADGLPIRMLEESGTVQSSLVERVIEVRVLAAEAKRKDDPEYWLRRAAYYHGRGEYEQVAAAVAKAWEVCADAKTEKKVLEAYAHYTRRADNPRRFLLDRLRAGDLSSHLAQCYVVVIVRLATKDAPIWKDEVWWSYLAKQKQWGNYYQGALIERLLEAGSAEDQAAIWQRACSLERAADPTRAWVIGKLLARRGEPKRGIAYMRDAVRRLPTQPSRGDAARDCYEACLASGDWKGADSMLMLERERWGGDPLWLRYRDLALCAAKAGARTEAMRIWRIYANFDLGRVSGIDAMVKLGLGDELLLFYREVGSKRALKALSPTR